MNRWLVLICMLLVSRASFATLSIEITQGVDNPTKLAVVPFQWQGRGLLPEDVSAIIRSDLERSGLFAFPKGRLLATPHQQSEVRFRDWRALGMEYLLIGKVIPGDQGQGYQVQYELFDVVRQQRIAFKRVSAGGSQLRRLAHYISDRVYEQLTGNPGAFSTRIMYVSVDQTRTKGKYQLLMADADGANERMLLSSPEPIVSPSWSPDGKQIAYVSFDSGRPAIYSQELATGKRQQLTRFKGLNGAPAWSPDGRRMAMVLSKDGNPEIYVMDLATKALTRLTKNFAIDTEPRWAPDGQSLVFTSNRGGKPQIYRVTLANRWVERLSFEGDYNARATVLPDGNRIVMVHRSGANFHIAVQNLLTGSVDVLTQTVLDESPSVAPNASMVMYATQRDGQGVLAVVSIDGRVKLFLPAKFKDVREPAWSPYL